MIRARRKRDENASKPAPPRVLGVDVPVPPPSGRKSSPSDEEMLKENLARDIFLAQMNEAVLPPDTQFTDSRPISSVDTESSPPSGMFPVPTTEPMPEMPWLSSEAFADVSMQGGENDMSWEGWQDLVRDFQMENNNFQAGEMSGVPLGGLKTWW